MPPTLFLDETLPLFHPTSIHLYNSKTAIFGVIPDDDDVDGVVVVAVYGVVGVDVVDLDPVPLPPPSLIYFFFEISVFAPFQCAE